MPFRASRLTFFNWLFLVGRAVESGGAVRNQVAELGRGPGLKGLD